MHPVVVACHTSGHSTRLAPPLKSGKHDFLTGPGRPFTQSAYFAVAPLLVAVSFMRPGLKPAPTGSKATPPRVILSVRCKMRISLT
jgi:hypothetical protein